jgi:hypothetical protein
MRGRAYLPYGLLSTALKPGGRTRRRPREEPTPAPDAPVSTPRPEQTARGSDAPPPRQAPETITRTKGTTESPSEKHDGHSAGNATPDSPRTVLAPDSPGPPSSNKEAPRARPERSTYEPSLPGPGRSKILTIPTIQCPVLYLFFIPSTRVPRVSPVSAHANYKRASGTSGLRRTAGRTLHPLDSFPLAAQHTRDLGDPPSLEQFVTPTTY